jgi:predicted dienelactone hydrolase
MDPIRSMLRALGRLLNRPEPPPSAAAGFREISVPFGDEPALLTGIWYPSHDPGRPRRMGMHESIVAVNGAVAGSSLPLVAMSHGSGGWYGAQYTTAMALADAGFVVASVTHPGDNFADRSRSFHVIDRPRHIRRVLDYMLREWPQRDRLDGGRVGMLGYSMGAFTTLVIAGGTPSLDRLDRYCIAHPDDRICRMARENNVDVHALNHGRRPSLGA